LPRIPTRDITDVDARWKSLGKGLYSPMRALCGHCRLGSLGILRFVAPPTDAQQARRDAVVWLDGINETIAAISGPIYDRFTPLQRSEVLAPLRRMKADLEERIGRLDAHLRHGLATVPEPPDGKEPDVRAPWTLLPEPAEGRPDPLYYGFRDTGYRISYDGRCDPDGRRRGAREHVIDLPASLRPEHRRWILAWHERWSPEGQHPRPPCRIFCPVCGTPNWLDWPEEVTRIEAVILDAIRRGVTREEIRRLPRSAGQAI
jgi:hypothetical protein